MAELRATITRPPEQRHFARRRDDVINEERLALSIAERIFQETEAKRVFKEALSEWLDHKLVQAGKCFGRAAAAIALFLVVSFMIWYQFRK